MAQSHKVEDILLQVQFSPYSRHPVSFYVTSLATASPFSGILSLFMIYLASAMFFIDFVCNSY